MIPRHLAIVLLAVACSSAAAAQEATSDSLDCVINPRAVVNVGSPAEGILREITVDRGDSVDRGQVVARLESGLEEAQVAIARARAESDVDLDSNRTRLDYQLSRDQRISKLYQKKVVSTESMDEVRTERMLAEYAVRSAETQKRIAALEQRRATEILKMRTIYSPVNGVIVERSMSAGEYAYAQSPVMTIAQIDPLNVEVYVPIARYGRISEGGEAEVRPVEPVGGVYQAKVSVVDKVFDAASGTFGVRLELPNPDHRLPAGIRCKVRFRQGQG